MIPQYRIMYSPAAVAALAQIYAYIAAGFSPKCGRHDGTDSGIN